MQDSFQNIANCIKIENKYRAAFLKRYATILLENFVPDLKNLLPEFGGQETGWLAIDKDLPKISGLHQSDEVALNRTEAVMLEEEGQAAALESLENERRELKNQVLSLEKRLAGVRIDLGLLKEKNEALEMVDQAEKPINVNSYYLLWDSSSSAQEKKATVGEILKASARQMYKYFGPLLASKNSEIKDLRKEMSDNKLNYERNMEDQARNVDSRIKSYLDTIDALNKKEANLKSQQLRLRQEADNHQRELGVLRNQLNSRKLEGESQQNKIMKLEKEVLESKTIYQLTKGKLESMERRSAEDRSLWDKERQAYEQSARICDSLQSEIDSLRRKIEKDQGEMSSLRIEIGRMREEEKARQVNQPEGVSSNSMSSGKRGLLDEIEKKNSELQSVLTELKNKQSKIESLTTELEDMTVRARSYERELSMLRSSNQLAGSQLGHNEGFNSTGHLALNSSRPSTSGGYQSHHATNLALMQKDQEITDLKATIEDLRREVDEKTSKMQGLIKFLGESESGFGDKERRLEKRLEQKDRELAVLRQEMVAREEEGERMRIDLEERLSSVVAEKEFLDAAVSDDKKRLTQLSKDLSDMNVMYQESLLEQESLRLQAASAASSRQEVEAKEEALMELRRQLQGLEGRLEEAASQREQAEYMAQQCQRSVAAMRRYQDIANQMYYHSVKCDTIYQGGIAIFVKYAKAVYIPLVFNYQPGSPKVGEVTREATVEALEAYCQQIRKLQEQICSVSFILDLNTVSPRLKKLLETNAMVAVCRVAGVEREKVDLKSNKELVSFVQSGIVYKVQVDEVLCLMSASFDNNLDCTELRQVESGAQNKTFQF